MKSMMVRIARWSAAAAGAGFAAVAAYVALNSIDCAAPDLSRFDNRQERPADADNVYCGLLAATNVVSEATGLPVMDSVFGRDCRDAGEQASGGRPEKTADELRRDEILSKRRKFWARYRNPNKRGDVTGEEKDEVLADAAKTLALFHEAVQRKAWYAFEPSTGERSILFPMVSLMVNFPSIVRLNVERQLERGEVGAAIESVRDIVQFAYKVDRGAESAVMWTISTSTLRIGLSGAMKVVKSGKATDGELAGLQEVLRSFDIKSRSGMVRRMMNNELCLVFVQMTDQDAVFASDVVWDEDFSAAMRIVRNPLLRRYAFHRNCTWAKYACQIDKVKELYSKGYDKSAWDELVDRFDEDFNDGGWRFGPNFVGRKIALDCEPMWRCLGESEARIEFSFISTAAVVAAERFRRKAGAYPKSLSDLVPEYLPSVPEDPFKKGSPLNYDAERGVIWTVGADGSFDGKPVKPEAEGKPGWGVYGKGKHDYIVNIDATPTK